MQSSREQRRPREASPLDRLIDLIAEIEVDRYLREVKARTEGKDEGSNLRQV